MASQNKVVWCITYISALSNEFCHEQLYMSRYHGQNLIGAHSEFVLQNSYTVKLVKSKTCEAESLLGVYPI